MDNSKIKIESDGERAEVYLDGEKISCTDINITFQGFIDTGIHIKWDGELHKRDEKGNLCIENDEIVTEKFHYDSYEELEKCAQSAEISSP